MSNTDKNKRNQNDNENDENPEEGDTENTDDESSGDNDNMQPATQDLINDTAILPEDALDRMRRGKSSRRYTDSLKKKNHEIVILIRGIVERVELDEGAQLVLGRQDAKGRNRIDMDLTQYGAVDRGVSREHCSLTFTKGVIYIEDLGSTNGTFINGKRLEARKKTRLEKGDELILGRLIVQVLFQ